MRCIRWARPLLLVALAAGLGCSDDKKSPTTPPPPSPPPATISLQLVASGFTDPVFMTQPPGDSRMFVVEKGGKIFVVKNGVTNATPFLDISGLVTTTYEQGLLSMAFRPDYTTSRRFYVCYTGTDGDVTVARYHPSSGNPDVAASAADEVVLRIEHSAATNHNGGLLLFGPDGKLYLGVGDGGADDDSGQNPGDLLGNILRIDVSGASGYTVPADNPFGTPVWSYGLRNPWRFSFDRSTGDLYIGDVGEAAWEEVDVATASSGRGKGLNFGWAIYEGTHCYAPPCSPTGQTMPVLEYPHEYNSSDQNAYCIIGGYVYRGSAIPGLQGHYFYGDVGGTWLRSFRYSGGSATEQTLWSVNLQDNPHSFAEDHQGELYVMTNGGNLWKIAP